MVASFRWTTRLLGLATDERKKAATTEAESAETHELPRPEERLAPYSSPRETPARSRPSCVVVRRRSRDQELYKGPRLSELNAESAAVEVEANGDFRMIGINQGSVKPGGTRTYVFAIDRNGNLPPGPVSGRPDVRFDAAVIVVQDPASLPSAKLFDFASSEYKTLAEDLVKIKGDLVEVVVPSKLLPSTGLLPTEYHVSYWPDRGGKAPLDAYTLRAEPLDLPGAHRSAQALSAQPWSANLAVAP